MSPSKKTIQNELDNEEAVLQCAARFDIVGDPTRMKICWLLCKHPELSVGEIAELLNMESSAISHALRKLKEVGVVSDRKEAKFKYYSLGSSPMCKFIKQSIS